MMFDTGTTAPRAKGWSVDDSQTIRFTDWPRADRTKRQIIENIEACEYLADLEDYANGESIVIDALSFYDETMSLEIDEAIKERRAELTYGASPRPAAPDTTAQQPNTATVATKGKTMFDIDTGNTGSEGPWIAWSARGTMDGAVPAKSFYLRDEAGKTPFGGFDKGVVLDIEKMKTGWQRSEGMAGVAPEWKWNPSVAQMAAQPGDDFKKGFSIPCAIGGGKTATWEQAGAAAWNAFVGIVPALQQGPGNGSLPLVKITGTKVQQFKRGSTVEPILEVIKWVPRPDCLKEGTAIATEPAPAAQPAPAPAPTAVDEEIGF